MGAGGERRLTLEGKMKGYPATMHEEIIDELGPGLNAFIKTT